MTATTLAPQTAEQHHLPPFELLIPGVVFAPYDRSNGHYNVLRAAHRILVGAGGTACELLVRPNIGCGDPFALLVLDSGDAEAVHAKTKEAYRALVAPDGPMDGQTLNTFAGEDWLSRTNGNEGKIPAGVEHKARLIVPQLRALLTGEELPASTGAPGQETPSLVHVGEFGVPTAVHPPGQPVTDPWYRLKLTYPNVPDSVLRPVCGWLLDAQAKIRSNDYTRRQNGPNPEFWPRRERELYERHLEETAELRRRADAYLAQHLQPVPQQDRKAPRVAAPSETRAIPPQPARQDAATRRKRWPFGRN